MHSDYSGHPAQPAQLDEIMEALPHRADDAAVAHRDDDHVGDLPSQLLGNLVCDRLLSLGHVRVEAGRPVVPAEALSGSEAQLDGIVIAAFHQKNR